MTVEIRQLRPSDYRPLISVIDEWWNGRHMADMLPRLFFDHFTDTSFAAERDGQLAGFLVGFVSQSRRGEAYIHFVGVEPGERGRGLGRQLYEHFFAAVRARGCDLVRAVTAPVNQGSVRFHQQMGFDIEPADSRAEGVPVASGYDGDGQDRVRFVKNLSLQMGRRAIARRMLVTCSRPSTSASKRGVIPGRDDPPRRERTRLPDAVHR
jgi:GNAT superfamily N-acetyltransferase